MFVDGRDLTHSQVDVAIGDDLERILTGDDPLVRLGLDPKRSLYAVEKLSKLFSQQPNEDHLHIIIQRPTGTFPVTFPALFLYADRMKYRRAPARRQRTSHREPV